MVNNTIIPLTLQINCSLKSLTQHKQEVRYLQVIKDYIGMSLLCFHFYLLCFSAIPKLQTHYAHELYRLCSLCQTFSLLSIKIVNSENLGLCLKLTWQSKHVPQNIIIHLCRAIITKLNHRNLTIFSLNPRAAGHSGQTHVLLLLLTNTCNIPVKQPNYAR